MSSAFELGFNVIVQKQKVANAGDKAPMPSPGRLERRSHVENFRKLFTSKIISHTSPAGLQYQRPPERHIYRLQVIEFPTC